MLPWAPAALEPPSNVTSDNGVQGKYTGSTVWLVAAQTVDVIKILKKSSWAPHVVIDRQEPSSLCLYGGVTWIEHTYLFLEDQIRLFGNFN